MNVVEVKYPAVILDAKITPLLHSLHIRPGLYYNTHVAILALCHL